MDYAESVSKAVSVKGYQYHNELNLFRSVRDIEKDSSRSYFTPYAIDEGSKLLNPIFPPIEVHKYDIDVLSPSSRITIRMNSSDNKYFIEILCEKSLVMRIDVSDVHEKIIGDEWFGGASFSPNEDYFVYVAGI
jgi:hypothetical protein